MQIEITPLGVTVGEVFRALDMGDLPPNLIGVLYNAATHTGIVQLTDAPPLPIGKQAFDNLYVKYIQRWKSAGTPPARTLQAIKLDKRAQINSIRDNLEQAGFPYMDKVIDSNPVSVQRITVAVQAAQAALGAGQLFSIDWTTQDNSVLTLNAVAMMGMPVALAMFAKNLHETARTKKELIDAAATAEDVEAVTWN